MLHHMIYVLAADIFFKNIFNQMQYDMATNNTIISSTLNIFYLFFK